MVALRSRRLERLLGDRLEDVTHAQITTLVTNAVGEAYDLDFKGELYGQSDKDKKSLAIDVAAMANTAGGVILLGIVEDAQARASSAPGVAVNDAEVNRIRQIVASQVAPLPTFDVLQVDDPGHAGHGYLMIAVPRSPSQPHAVVVNDALRFPKRNGTTTTYLSEPQVADAYAARLASIANRRDELDRQETEFVSRLDHMERTFVVLTLVPDLPGDFRVDARTASAFKKEVVNTNPLVLDRGVQWQQVSVATQRLTAWGELNGTGPTKSLACELHESGAGCFGVAVDELVEGRTVSHINDESAVNAVWSGLRFLARHARDRSAAGGNASVRATIWPVSGAIPAALIQYRPHGSPCPLGKHIAERRTFSTGVFSVDDLAEDGAPMLAAAHALTSGLFQAFGVPEVPQIRRDGALRNRYWHHSREELEQWAKDAGVDWVDEKID
jgi:hypothetical protein